MMVPNPIVIEVFRVSFELNFILMPKLLSVFCANHLRRMKIRCSVSKYSLMNLRLELRQRKMVKTFVNDSLHDCGYGKKMNINNKNIP